MLTLVGAAVVVALVVLIATLLTRDDDEPLVAATTTTSTTASTTTTTEAPPDESVDGEDPPAPCVDDDRDAAPLRPASRVRVVTGNASGTSGLARDVAEALARVGHPTGRSMNATTRLDRTVVGFPPGLCAEAVAVAAALDLPTAPVVAIPASPPIEDPGELDADTVLVMVGPDAAEVVR